jgi:uncharacterized protein involved in tolerance to divalent cations
LPTYDGEQLGPTNQPKHLESTDYVKSKLVAKA